MEYCPFPSWPATSGSPAKWWGWLDLGRALSLRDLREEVGRKLVRMVELAAGQMPAVYESQGQVVICAFRGHHADPPPNLAGSHVQSSPQATTCPMPLPPQTTGPFFISLAKPSHRTT